MTDDGGNQDARCRRRRGLAPTGFDRERGEREGMPMSYIKVKSCSVRSCFRGKQ